MSRAWTSGRPALIIVANWRVNTTTSRVLTPPPNLKLSLNSLGAARTCTTTMRFFRRCAMTRSEEHTSELQSQSNLVCRLLLEKKKTLRVITEQHLTSSQHATC